MLRALKEHWPEYVCEAAELGLFMISAGLFTILLFHPGSPAVAFIPDPFMRRMCVGIAMGGTAIALVFSPLGKRSGAHFNPAVTLTFWRLGKIKNWDALFYILAQFIGGIAGVFLVSLFAGMALSHPAVNYVATLPGSRGVGVAFLAEFVIAFILMSVVLRVSNTPHLARFTGLVCRCTGGHLHHLRSAAVWHEYESGAHLWFGLCRSSLGWAVDLLHCPCARDATGRIALFTRTRRSLLRKVPSSQSAALHLQLPVR